MRAVDPPLPRAPWAKVVRSLTFVRKELAEIVRQPRLLALLVFGPFILLLLFGSGYSQEQLVMRTLFVGPAGSVFEEVVERYADDLGDFVSSEGYQQDEDDAIDHLSAGDVDVVVVFPDDPVDTVLGGERAVIRVLHNEIDPIRQTAVEVAARIAIQEVNSAVLSSVAGGAQERMEPLLEIADEMALLAGELEADAATGTWDRDTSDALTASLVRLDGILLGSETILGRLGGDTGSDDLATVRSTSETVRRELAALQQTSDEEDVRRAVGQTRELSELLGTVTTLDPQILVRPFEHDTATVNPRRVEPRSYFTPAALALLLQHMALTFAALSLVRDRRTGLFELLRIGPLSSFEIIIGKCAAYLLISGVVAVALLALAVYVLGVPFLGSAAWLVAMVAGVVLSSLALGMAISMVSSTESQAVQMAMLTLLAGLFFSGFVLSLEDLAYPVKLISWILPVTYGIRTFQDVMLRGTVPSTFDVAGISALVLVYGTIAVMLLQRRLRTE
jgi:ABC-2 type transport system permease protein